MSKTETLEQCTDASNAKRAVSMTQQMENLRQAKLQSAEELEAKLEPLAQAMAVLTDETRDALAQMRQQSAQQLADFQTQSQAIMHTWDHSTQLMDKAAGNLEQATAKLQATVTVNTSGLGWKHYALTVATGMLAAMLALGLWTWLSAKPVTTTRPSKSRATVLHKPSSTNSKPLG
jgi:hypothetical protein